MSDDASTSWPCTAGIAEVAALLAAVEGARGLAPLSDPLAIDVRNGTGTLVARCDDTGVAGVAQLSPPAQADGAPWQLQTVTRPGASRAQLVEALAVGVLAEAGAGTACSVGGADTAAERASDRVTVDWWVFADDADARATMTAAFALGFRLDRELLIMRRPLPTPQRATVGTRAFVPSVDDAAWVTVNNRAFAGHAEQGGWTVEMLAQRRAEPWFDPDGFRVYEHDGRMLAFCWTKVHGSGTDAVRDDRVGEIYVIGVDPDAQGQGLGRQLTQAGLDWMTDQGITEALLYVAGDNTAAIATYERLGFAVARRDRCFRRG